MEGSKPATVYRCDMCSVKCRTLRKFLGHLKIKHSGSPNFRVLCTVGKCCRPPFKEYKKFIKHLHNSHPGLLKVSSSKEKASETEPEYAYEEAEAETSMIDNEPDDMQVNFAEVPASSSLTCSSMKAADDHTRKFALFILKYREVHLLPRTVVEELIKDLIKLFEPELPVENITAFNNIRSEYFLSKYCENSLNYIKPITHVLGESMRGNKLVKDTFQYIPIIQVLQQYFSSSNISLDHDQSSSALASYRDGQYFKNNSLFVEHPNALRLVLYSDEFEVSNPLGPKKGAHKLMPFYFLLDNILPNLKASLKHIHLCILAKFSHVKKYGYGPILKPLLEDIHQLESEGIQLNMNGKTVHLFGSLIALCGDNLSAHGIGGFNQNFAHGRICRFCMASKDMIDSHFNESDYVLRNPATQKRHVEAVNKSKLFSKLYGVNSDCVFSSLASFDATTSLPPDLMHDLLEGVVPYVISCVIKNLVRTKVFSYQDLEGWMSSFCYGKHDLPNKPVPIKNLNRFSLSGTAAQKMCMIRLLPLILGEKVPEDHPVWQLLLLCREIVEITVAPIIEEDWLFLLKLIIVEQNQLYAKYSVNFPAKFHYLIHYPSLIKKFGPLRSFWCYRFEGKHQHLKRLASVSRNFRNIEFTVSSRHQYLQCFHFNEVLEEDICERKSTRMDSSVLNNDLKEEFKMVTGISLPEDVICAQSVVKNCQEYHVGSVLVLGMIDCDTPIFGQIKMICYVQESWYLCCKICITRQFLQHFYAFEIVEGQYWCIKPLQELKSVQCLDIYQIGEKKMVTLKFKCTEE